MDFQHQVIVFGGGDGEAVQTVLATDWAEKRPEQTLTASRLAGSPSA